MVAAKNLSYKYAILAYGTESTMAAIWQHQSL